MDLKLNDVKSDYKPFMKKIKKSEYLINIFEHIFKSMQKFYRFLEISDGAIPMASKERALGIGEFPKKLKA